jgi:hypothetical protein
LLCPLLWCPPLPLSLPRPPPFMLRELAAAGEYNARDQPSVRSN